MTKLYAWHGNDSEGPIRIRLDSSGYADHFSIEKSRMIRDELSAAIREEEVYIASRACKASPDQVREALCALTTYVYLKDGERGAVGAIWTALRALSPDLAELAEEDPHGAAKALGAFPEDEDSDDYSPAAGAKE